MNSSELHCIIDCSGSMAEYGKPMLMVNLLRHIRQFTEQQGNSTRYLSWKENIAEIFWLPEGDVELPAVENGSDIPSFCDWVEANHEATFLVLTDGCFKLNTKQRQLISQLDNIYLIGVGGDADLAKLSTLSNHSYRAERLDHVLHTIFRPSAATSAPLSRVDLSGSAAVEGGVEDEW